MIVIARTNDAILARPASRIALWFGLAFIACGIAAVVARALGALRRREHSRTAALAVLGGLSMPVVSALAGLFNIPVWSEREFVPVARSLQNVWPDPVVVAADGTVSCNGRVVFDGTSSEDPVQLNLALHEIATGMQVEHFNPEGGTGPMVPGEWLIIRIDPEAPIASLGLVIRGACMSGVGITKVSIEDQRDGSVFRDYLPSTVGTSCYGDDPPPSRLNVPLGDGGSADFVLKQPASAVTSVSDFDELVSMIERIETSVVELVLEGQLQWKYAKDALNLLETRLGDDHSRFRFATFHILD